jgi:hypothetical protein
VIFTVRCTFATVNGLTFSISLKASRVLVVGSRSGFIKLSTNPWDEEGREKDANEGTCGEKNRHCRGKRKEAKPMNERYESNRYRYVEVDHNQLLICLSHASAPDD